MGSGGHYLLAGSPYTVHYDLWVLHGGGALKKPGEDSAKEEMLGKTSSR